MLTCKETTELVSKEVDDGLSFKERVDMRLHLMMCSACRNYRSNVGFLRRACKEAATPGRNTDETKGRP
jgi:predicted anti-sigma-YlaC factor YlaD